MGFSPVNSGICAASEAPAGGTPLASGFRGFLGDWVILQPPHQCPGGPGPARKRPLCLQGPELLSLLSTREVTPSVAALASLPQSPGKVAAQGGSRLHTRNGEQLLPLCCPSAGQVLGRACVSRRPLGKGTRPQTSFPTTALSPARPIATPESIAGCRFKALFPLFPPVRPWLAGYRGSCSLQVHILL